ncbi:Hsp70 family protein [Singulisphaera acidiphila]|uniref:Molecular chaperone n=1 Tax=Singulisphaera acidiphila (strain ATCC BAA-1392 / DSM 18658 / VKM B-2454 / MOB10) TaxID=886293 RepID=L0D5Q5_SINAD|nr:Hsp70 family protein [Singulisphaera acidiphila]AGA24592.1 molecular chaperone [Singulisphaera acidiphila DSM 18658]
MDVIIGIDLGTTNSEVAVIRDGRPVVLEEDGDPILPSVVGLDPQGRLLVGKAARNQAMLAPERTVRSIKRKMGLEEMVPLGDKKYSPQEISAIILRTLKQRAEKVLGHPVKKAVITVPAFFTEGQRAATREAGELAELEVVRIINEPTAAVLTYDPHPAEMERLLVYDLGGGTFDVSIAQVEQGVVEILASHGDTHLGGDDFDQRLLDYVCDRFQTKHGIDLRELPVAKSRLLRAVEDAKKELSTEATTTIAEEFIAEKNGIPLNLNLEVDRYEYEELIEPLLAKTLVCLDKAMSDAKVQAHEIHKVLLVGGATRTPMVHRILSERLGRPVHTEIEPDLAVAMGAAVQGGLIAGIDVGPVLVDITPHTLGIEALGELHGSMSIHCFSAIIERNTPLPASRTEIYATASHNQKIAQIRVFQGEDEDTRYNTLVGEFTIEGLADLPAGNQILVRLDLDLNGILKVTATERATGLARHVTIDNAMERFRQRQRTDAIDRLEEVFGTAEQPIELEEGEFSVTPGALGDPSAESLSPALQQAISSATALIAKAEKVATRANPEDAAELKAMLTDLQLAIDKRSADDIQSVAHEVEDLVFYLEDQ